MNPKASRHKFFSTILLLQITFIATCFGLDQSQEQKLRRLSSFGNAKCTLQFPEAIDLLSQIIGSEPTFTHALANLSCEVRSKFRPDDSFDAKLSTVSRFLFREKGFKYSTSLNMGSILEGKSNCLGLSIAYYSISKELGLEVEISRLLNHFFIRSAKEGNAQCIETTLSGNSMDPLRIIAGNKDLKRIGVDVSQIESISERQLIASLIVECVFEVDLKSDLRTELLKAAVAMFPDDWISRQSLGFNLENSGKCGRLQFKKALSICEEKNWPKLALCFAVASDDMEKLILLSKVVGDVNFPACDGQFPLGFSTSKTTTKYLLRIGADPNLTDENGRGLVHFAASSGKVDILRQLVKQNAIINIMDTHGLTPLHVAGNRSVAEFLIKNGSILNAKDDAGRSALSCALLRENTEVADFLIDIGADLFQRDANGETVFHHAAISNSSKVLDRIFRKNGQINSLSHTNLTPLMIAVLYRKGNAVDTLLKLGANPNIQGFKGVTALHLAVGLENAQLTRTLLRFGANPLIVDKSGRNALGY